MAIKNFNELFKLDIAEHIKKKPIYKKGQNGQLVLAPEEEWLDFIEWARVLVLLYDNDAEKVKFGIIPNETGHPIFTNKNNAAPFIKVFVEIDDRREEAYYPLISGNKNESQDNQNAISFAEKRAFVKCVAINWGLGLKLWLDNEQKLIENPVVIDEEKNRSLNARMLQLFQTAIGLLGDANNVHAELNTNKKELDVLYKSNDTDKKQYYIDLLTDLIAKIKTKK